MTAWEETCVLGWEKATYSRTLACRYMNMSALIRGHLHGERTVCAETQEPPTAVFLKIQNKPKHHLLCFNAGVLCKSNWVEHRAPASYFCSKNALSKVMRAGFEVAPAGKYSRRLCGCVCVCPPTEKSLFSFNCCFPKSCSLTVLHRV